MTAAPTVQPEDTEPDVRTEEEEEEEKEEQWGEGEREGEGEKERLTNGECANPGCTTRGDAQLLMHTRGDGFCSPSCCVQGRIRGLRPAPRPALRTSPLKHTVVLPADSWSGPVRGCIFSTVDGVTGYTRDVPMGSCTGRRCPGCRWCTDETGLRPADTSRVAAHIDGLRTAVEQQQEAAAERQRLKQQRMDTAQRAQTRRAHAWLIQTGSAVDTTRLQDTDTVGPVEWVAGDCDDPSTWMQWSSVDGLTPFDMMTVGAGTGIQVIH
jgi:hypothetical protein